MKAKYDHLIAEGKTEEDAMSVLKAVVIIKHLVLKNNPLFPFQKKVKLSVLLKIVEDNKGKRSIVLSIISTFKKGRLQKNSKTSPPQMFANLF